MCISCFKLYGYGSLMHFHTNTFVCIPLLTCMSVIFAKLYTEMCTGLHACMRMCLFGERATGISGIIAVQMHWRLNDKSFAERKAIWVIPTAERNCQRMACFISISDAITTTTIFFFIFLFNPQRWFPSFSEQPKSDGWRKLVKVRVLLSLLILAFMLLEIAIIQEHNFSWLAHPRKT